MKNMTRTLKHNWRMIAAGLIAVLFMAVMFVGGGTPYKASADTTTYEYLALGDSITAGWGLDDDSTPENEADTYGFVGMLATSLGKTYYNAGYNGQTTTSLITSFASASTTLLSAVATADLITITIGGNDLMAVFYSFIAEVVTGGAYNASDVETILTDIETYETQALLILGLLSSKDYSSELENYTAFTNAVSTAVANINTVTSTIKQYNSSAIILVANQYNPYTWLGSGYQNITNLFETGVTNFNTALSNAASKNYTIVDIYSAFAASKTELTNITLDYYEFDYHPNDSGHLVFKNTMLTAYNEALNSGSGTTVVSESSIQLGIGSIAGYDSTNGYSYIYLGFDSNGNQVKWRVLDDETNMGTTGLYLLTDTIVDSGVTFSSSNSKVYQGSDAQAWCEDYYTNYLSAIEQSAIISTYKDDSAYIDSINSYTYTATDSILNGDYVFFMSAEEMYNSDYGFTDDDATRKVDMYQASTSTVKTAVYFLRSPSKYTGVVGSVSQEGEVFGTFAVYSYGARPAMNFDTTNVMFVSAASGGKSASGMDSGLTAIDTYTGSEWKATIYDSARSNFTASKVSRGINTVTIEYSGAKIGTNEYLSAVVLDSNGEITQYGRIAKLDGTTYSNSGTVTVDISSLSSTDTLYIINEQYNGDYESDASSALTAIDTTMTLDDLAGAVEEMQADILASQIDIINAANTNLTSSLLNFAAIANDSNSTTSDLISGVMSLLADYSSAYTSLEQVTAINPTDSTLLASMAALETTLTTANSTITAAVTTLQTNITSQISALQTAGSELSTQLSSLSTLVDTLSSNLTALQTTVGNLDGTYATDTELSTVISSLQTMLESAIATAQQAAVDAAQASLEAAVANLEAVDTAFETRIGDLETAMETAKNTLDNLDGTYATDAELAAKVAELGTLIANAQQAAVDAVQANLDSAVADLEAVDTAFETRIGDLETAMETAKNTLDNLDGTYTTDAELAAKVAELETLITNAQQAAVDAAQANLDSAVANLEAAIASGDSDLLAEINALDTAYKAADMVINGKITDLQTKDAELEASIGNLETSMNSADGVLQAAIDTVQANLDSAVANLEAAIASGDSDLSDEIAALDAAYQEADAVINGSIAELQTKDSELAASITYLHALVNTSDNALQAAINTVQGNLELAVTSLNTAIESGVSELSSQLAALEEAYNTAAALINSNLVTLQTTDSQLAASIAALETAYATADSALETAIGNLQQDLADAKAELEAKDAALEAKDAEMEDKIAQLEDDASTWQTICIAVFAVLGVLVVCDLVLLIITRRKKS